MRRWLGRARDWLTGLLPSLRLRLVVVFAMVALSAAVAASGIAYWLTRDAVVNRAQNAALKDFHKTLGDHAGTLPPRPKCEQLKEAADAIAGSTQNYEVVLVDLERDGRQCAVASSENFELGDVPKKLRNAVVEERPSDGGTDAAHHQYWQRVNLDGTPYLISGATVIGEGPAGYMRKSLDQEQDDLTSLAWSLAIATGLALIGSVLLAQAAASTVLRPVQRLATPRADWARASWKPG